MPRGARAGAAGGLILTFEEYRKFSELDARNKLQARGIRGTPLRTCVLGTPSLRNLVGNWIRYVCDFSRVTCRPGIEQGNNSEGLRSERKNP